MRDKCLKIVGEPILGSADTWEDNIKKDFEKDRLRV
jgi:hypothetical protein